MIHLFPLTVPWLVGVLLLVLDGRKHWASFGATAILAAATVLDATLFVRMALGRGSSFEVVTGSWPTGVGIRLYVDQLSLLFGAVSAAVSTVVLWSESSSGVRSRLFPGLLLLLNSGLHGAFFTGDLFNFYVFFELSMVSSFALAAYGYGRAEVRGALVYVAMNLIGSVLFLVGVAMLYRASGTLDLHQLTKNMPHGRVVLPATLLFVALSLKLGLFPFHGWVPVLYSHARPVVAAALSGALVNIGAYGLLRLGYTVLESARQQGSLVLVCLGLLAAIYGGMLALHRQDPAELAAYLSIVHAGYIVFALGIGGVFGIMALLLTVIAGSIDKSMMFLSLDDGASNRSTMSLVGACSAAGLPFTLGFSSKVLLLRSALESPMASTVATLFLLSGAVMLTAAFRFWRLARKATPAESSPSRKSASLGLATLTASTIILGTITDPVIAAVSNIASTTAGATP